MSILGPISSKYVQRQRSLVDILLEDMGAENIVLDEVIFCWQQMLVYKKIKLMDERVI